MIKGARAKHQESNNHRTSIYVQVKTDQIRLTSVAIVSRVSIEEHRESRDPNYPRDYIDCYLDQVFLAPEHLKDNRRIILTATQIK